MLFRSFSGATRGMMVGYVSPEAGVGGPLGLVKDGDRIVIDAVRGLLSLDVAPSVLRKRSLKKPEQFLSGVLEKYAAQVGSAFRGAVTHSGPRK